MKEWARHLQQGVEAAKQGDLDGAERHYRETLRLNPGKARDESSVDAQKLLDQIQPQKAQKAQRRISPVKRKVMGLSEYLADLDLMPWFKSVGKSIDEPLHRISHWDEWPGPLSKPTEAAHLRQYGRRAFLS